MKNKNNSPVIFAITIFIISFLFLIFYSKISPYLLLLLDSAWVTKIATLYFIAIAITHLMYCNILNTVKSLELIWESTFSYYIDYVLNWATLYAIAITGVNLLRGIILQLCFGNKKLYFPFFSKLDLYVILSVSIILFLYSFNKSIRLFKEALIMKDSVEPQKITN